MLFRSLGVDVAAGARLDLRLNGGLGEDDLIVRHTGIVTGTMNIVSDGGSGKDSIETGLGLASGYTGKVGASIYGGAGADYLGMLVDPTDPLSLKRVVGWVHGDKADRVNATAGRTKVM